MAEIEDPPGRAPRRPPYQRPPPRGEEATGESLIASACSICCGGCCCIEGLAFAFFLFVPYGGAFVMGLLGLGSLILGIFLLKWGCENAQRHNRVSYR
jgi:hypothetical protein